LEELQRTVKQVEGNKLRQVLKKNKKALLKYPNVVFVGIGNKITDGKNTGEMALVVGVSKKMKLSALVKMSGSLKGVVPKILDGQMTDVQEVGVIRKLSLNTRIRPAVPGYSVGHFLITAGTIGLKVYDLETREPLLLSNNHVLANCDDAQVGDEIVQPGPHDGGSVPADVIALLLRWANLMGGSQNQCALVNWFARVWHRLAATPLKVDCAVARLISPDILIDEIAGAVKPIGILEAEVNMACRKWGRTTELTQGKVIAVQATVQVDYGYLGDLTFEDQIIGDLHSEGGDSGSAVLSGDAVIGLLFAGSDTVTVFNRIQNVFEALNVGLQSAAVNQVKVTVVDTQNRTFEGYIPELIS
jgi:hypothetical protein